MRETYKITFNNGHTHNARGWMGDIEVTNEYIIHHNIPNADGKGVHELVIVMSSVMFYEKYIEEIIITE